MTIRLPEKAAYIIDVLEQAGHEAFAVGGCVRDSCLSRTPKDWDITTSATPQQVMALFPHTVDTGMKHGTITVMLRGEGFEVTTYRIDGIYEDGRHPQQVTFTGSLEEDLKRRDFTVNAMAYNPRCGLVDLFGGRRDLSARIIRCVGDAKARFEEDALRILRAVRFAAQLDFSIEQDTQLAIRDLAGNLDKISAERIRAELSQLITSPHPERLLEAYKLGVTAVILPEFDAAMRQPQNSTHHIYSVGIHTIKSMAAIPADEVLRTAMLLHDLGKTDAVTVDDAGIYHFKKHAAFSEETGRKILRRLKYDNASRNRILRLVACHSLYPEETPEGVRTAVYRIGPDLFEDFLLVKRADTLGQNPQVWVKKLAYLERIGELYRQIRERGDCLSLNQLQVRGSDLVDAGMQPGPQIGAVLERMLQDVLQCPVHNEKTYLMEQLRAGRYEHESAPAPAPAKGSARHPADFG